MQVGNVLLYIKCQVGHYKYYYAVFERMHLILRELTMNAFTVLLNLLNTAIMYNVFNLNPMIYHCIKNVIFTGNGLLV